MARNESLNRDIDGIFIYKDDKNRSIYSNPFMKDGYVINKSEIRPYTFYSSRPIVALAVGTMPCFFMDNWYVCIALGVVTYIVLAVLFHKKFLAGCRHIENFTKEKERGFIARSIRNEPASKLLVSTGLSLLLFVAAVINLIYMKFQGIELAIYIVLLVCIFLYFLFTCYLFIQKRKQDR